MDKDLYLVLTFKDTENNNYSITLKNAKPDVTEEEIIKTMDTVIAENIFECKGNDLISKVKANIVTKQTQKFDLV